MLSNPDYQTTDKDGNITVNMDKLRKDYDGGLDTFNSVVGRYKDAAGITSRQDAEDLKAKRAHELLTKTAPAQIRADALKNGKGNGGYNLSPEALAQMDADDALEAQAFSKQLEENKGMITRPDGSQYYVSPSDYNNEYTNMITEQVRNLSPNWGFGDVPRKDVMKALSPKDIRNRTSRSNAGQ